MILKTLSLMRRYFFVITAIALVGIIITCVRKQKTTKPSFKTIATRIKQLDGGKRLNKSVSCGEWPKRPAGFVEIQPETLVYSAWYDNRQIKPYIRVLILSDSRLKPTMFCHIKGKRENETVSSKIEYFPLSMNAYWKIGAFIGSCPVPEGIKNIPCDIRISTTASVFEHLVNDSAVLSLGFIGNSSKDARQTWKYGICIPPVHDQIPLEWLIEFLELSRILGASHFIFYDYAMSDTIKQILSYYESKGLVSVPPWKLSKHIKVSTTHYFGQTLAIIDCLYRSIDFLDFVAFNDLDEFITPLEYHNMTSLLETYRKEQYSGYCFTSSIFDPSWEDNQGTATNNTLLTQRVIVRTRDPVPSWKKCVVNPRRVFQQGVHYIRKPIEARYTPRGVDWDIARVFHYRRCLDPQAHFRPKCSGFAVDKTMKKFGERLQFQFECVKRSLRELHVAI